MIYFFFLYRNFTKNADSCCFMFFNLINRFLEHCRPLSVSMLNALSYVKTTMGEECTDMRTASEFATNIKETIIRFVEVEIGLARRAIVANAKDKITDGDVVLIYARLVHRNHSI